MTSCCKIKTTVKKLSIKLDYECENMFIDKVITFISLPFGLSVEMQADFFYYSAVLYIEELMV